MCSCSFAQFEREVTAERIRDKVARRRRRACGWAACVPLGYDVDGPQTRGERRRALPTKSAGIFARFVEVGSSDVNWRARLRTQSGTRTQAGQPWIDKKYHLSGC
jgi:DNA invertase Pin-like site-specific DNA recombinase